MKITTDSFGVDYQRDVKMRLNNKSHLLKMGLITTQRNHLITNLLKSFYRLANLNLKFGEHIGNRDFVKFWDHSKQHSSKTFNCDDINRLRFWDHSKQHSSKTARPNASHNNLFWDHSKQHSSKTLIKVYAKRFEVLGPFKTT